MVPKVLDQELKRQVTPGYATYLSDWNKANVLQDMMDVDPKCMVQYKALRYDSVEIVGTWKINNKLQQEQFDAARTKIKETSPNEEESAYDIPDLCAAHESACQQTFGQKSRRSVLASWITRRENLHTILFEGHKTELSNNGLFGRGIYFAENVAKIHQYATNDEHYQIDGNLGELHERIYAESKCLHPHNARYALVCRVLLACLSSQKMALLLSIMMGSGKKVFASDARNSLASLQKHQQIDCVAGS